MSRIVKGLAVLAATVALASSASHAEQGLVMWHDVSLDMAKRIAEATLAECRAKGFHTAAVVVDRSGNMLVYMRDEQTSPQTGELARRKAYTARMYRTTTLDWVRRMREDPSLEPQRDLPDLIALGGGAPIKFGDETIGGVGGAGSSQQQDDACTKAGVARFSMLNANTR